MTLDLAGFDRTTFTNGVAYNLLDCKQVHLILHEDLENEKYLAKPLSIAMILELQEKSMEKDVSWKEYFRDDERYADVINGIGCGGLQLVAGEGLQEADTQTVLGRMFGLAGKGKRIRMRDVVRKAAFGVNFAIVGFENQEIVDYGMPLRCMELTECSAQMLWEVKEGLQSKN